MLGWSARLWSVLTTLRTPSNDYDFRGLCHYLSLLLYGAFGYPHLGEDLCMEVITVSLHKGWEHHADGTPEGQVPNSFDKDLGRLILELLSQHQGG